MIAGDKDLSYRFRTVGTVVVDWAQVLNDLTRNYGERLQTLNFRVVGTEDRPVVVLGLGHGGEAFWLRGGRKRWARLRRGWRRCYCSVQPHLFR